VQTDGLSIFSGTIKVKMSTDEITQPPRDDLDEATCSEMIRLWYQFRVAAMNALYYADLEERCDRWNTRLLLAIAVLTLCTAAISAAKEFRDAYGLYAAITGALSFVLAGAVPYLELDKKAKKYGHLGRSFLFVQNQLHEVLTLMRRDGLNDELLGRSKQLLTSMAFYKSSDPTGTEEAEIKYTIRINEKYPPDYVWDHL
jgi:hypothetical protein